MKTKLKGVILAAGLGSRLAPLTQKTPKPLLPFGPFKLIDYAYKKLLKAGIEEIAINTHHLSDQLIKWARPKGIQVFHEKQILGTLGAFLPMKNWRKNSDLVVLNSDIYHPTPLKDLLSVYDLQGPDILMSTRSPKIETATTLWVSKGKLQKIGGDAIGEQHSFACMQVISHKMLELIPKGFQELKNIYNQWLATGHDIQVLPTTGPWADLGTPHEYYQSHFLLEPSTANFQFFPLGTSLKQKGLSIEGPCYISFDVLNQNQFGSVGPGSVIYSGCHLEGASVRESLLLPQTVCSKHEAIESQIRSQDFSIPL